MLIRHAGRCRMQGGAVGIGRAGSGRTECRRVSALDRGSSCCCCCCCLRPARAGSSGAETVTVAHMMTQAQLLEEQFAEFLDAYEALVKNVDGVATVSWDEARCRRYLKLGGGKTAASGAPWQPPSYGNLPHVGGCCVARTEGHGAP